MQILKFFLLIFSLPLGCSFFTLHPAQFPSSNPREKNQCLNYKFFVCLFEHFIFIGQKFWKIRSQKTGKLTIHFLVLGGKRHGEAWGFLSGFFPFHNILQLNHALFQSFKVKGFLIPGQKRFLACNANKNETCIKDYLGFFFSGYRPSYIKENSEKQNQVLPKLSLFSPALKSTHLSRRVYQQANYIPHNRLQFLFPLLWCIYRLGRYLSVLAFAFVTNFQFFYGHTQSLTC